MQYQDVLLILADGGGIRGFSTLLILEALMARCGEFERAEDERADREERLQPNFGLERPESIMSGTLDMGSPLPCHYFDYVVGTSTGE